jgi:hypothetical protein
MINPALTSMLQGHASGMDRIQSAAAEVAMVLRSVWNESVTIDDMMEYGFQEATHTIYPNHAYAADYLRYVYFELCANNRDELQKIRQWLQARQEKAK